MRWSNNELEEVTKPGPVTKPLYFKIGYLNKITINLIN